MPRETIAWCAAPFPVHHTPISSFPAPDNLQGKVHTTSCLWACRMESMIFFQSEGEVDRDDIGEERPY